MIGLRDRHVVPDRSGRRASRGGATGAQEPPDHALLLRPLGRDARAREREPGCTFAVWASKQPEDDSRDEDLVRTLRMRLTRSSVLQGPILRLIEPCRRTDRARCTAPGEADCRSGAIPTFVGRRGTRNKKVFEEIGREFARFLIAEGRRRPRRGSTGSAASFEPARRRTDRTSWARRFAPTTGHVSTPTRTRCPVGAVREPEDRLHEQTRLQPEITEALDATVVPPAELRRLVYDSTLEQLPLFGRLLRFVLPWIRRRYEALAGEIAESARIAEDCQAAPAVDHAAARPDPAARPRSRPALPGGAPDADERGPRRAARAGRVGARQSDRERRERLVGPRRVTWHVLHRCALPLRAAGSPPVRSPVRGGSDRAGSRGELFAGDL